MAIEMEIISQEIIKPSTPTPFHLRNLKLSLLDQMSPPIYVPLIFFYSHDQLTHQNRSHGQVSQLLKQSLSQILTVFYPLAGRIRKNSLIDCDDSGAEFVEARVHTRLSEIIDEPSMEELRKLEPSHSLGEEDEHVVLKVKICFFKCGGISVAVCLSHKIADGTSLVAFIGAWAASCRGETQDFGPSFEFASYFPPRDLNFTPREGIADGKIATKRLVFSKKELTKLKEDCVAEYFSDGGSSRVREPTRVEAVSSYIWRRFMDLSKAKDSAKTMTFVAVHAVNLRPRKIPSLPQHMFGNCWLPAVAVSENPCNLAAKLRAAISEIGNDYIRTVESGEYLNQLAKTVGLYKKDGVEFCNFSSWCRFPVYEVDFEWGKPVWVCTTTMPFKNLVILMGSPCGEGIEAWVSVVEEDMELF